MKRKSRYIPLTQQSFCCMPACIQMVLLRRKLQMLPQEEIGHDLGLIVPKKYKKILPTARTGKMPPSGYGTQENKHSLNKFFKKHKIPLRKESFQPSEIKNTEKWIEENIKKDNDILVCFKGGLLYGGKGRGHLSVVDSISGDEVTLIDPSRLVPKYRKVKLKRLIMAMEKHPTGGFHLIMPAKKKR